MSVLLALLLTLIAGSQLSLTGVAGANVSESFHELPWTGEGGVSQSPRCASISPGYACTVGGYAAWLAHPSGWAWSDYGGPYPSHNAYGPHNCTLYVAYLLQESGITLSWSANASNWASEAVSNGAVVNQTPAVGSVAQWNSGHIAFVDAVTARYILITSDNFQPYDVGTMPGGFTDSFDIARNSPTMPDNFIHFATPVAQLLAVLHAGQQHPVALGAAPCVRANSPVSHYRVANWLLRTGHSECFTPNAKAPVIGSRLVAWVSDTKRSEVGILANEMSANV